MKKDLKSKLLVSVLAASLLVGNAVPALGAEIKPEKPGLEIVERNGDVVGLTVQNNEDDYSSIMHGFATQEEIDEGTVRLQSGIGVDAFESFTFTMEDFLRYELWTAGTYYFVAYTEGEGNTKSE